MQDALRWFVRHYHMSDPILLDFLASISVDMGFGVDHLSNNLDEARRVIDEFCRGPAGPRVELRRWLTWIRSCRLC